MMQKEVISGELISPNCPRCGSSNTKFCYYNNYSLTQPRYFCKGCRRYWTKGGSLRHVPVGGGCRKSRRGNYKRQTSQSNIPHDDGLKRANSSSSTPSLGSESDIGPNIDLAQVYASFLNQKSDSTKTELDEKPDQVQTVFYSTSPEHLSLHNTDFDQSALLPDQELGLTGCLHLHEQSTESSHFSEEGSVQMYLCGFSSIQKHLEYSSFHEDTNNFELPPLPGEETLPSHEMFWSNSEMMIDHTLETTTQLSPPFGTEARDAELLMGNWSPFDLSSPS